MAEDITLARPAAAAPTLSAWLAEARATLALALPLAGSLLAQIAMHTTDLLYMGWLAPQALAAGTLGGTLYFVTLLFGFGITTAVAPLAAQAVGGRKPYTLYRVVRQGLWAAGLIGGPGVIVLWHTEAILLVLGQEPANAALAQAYVRPMLAGLVPALWFNALRGFVAATGRARPILVITGAAVLLNAAIGYALAFGGLGWPPLGIAGIGVATSIVQVALVLTLLVHARRMRGLARFVRLGHVLRPDRKWLAETFRVGLPIGGALLAEVGLFSGGSLLMGLIGTHALAAHAIALQWASIAFMLPMGIGQAATVRVGVAAGAGDLAGIRRSGRTAFALGVIASVASGLLFWLWPQPLIAAFLDESQSDAAAVLDLGVGFLLLAALFQLADGAQAIGHGVLRGLKDTRWPMLIAVFGYWAVGFVLAVLLAFPLGAGGPGIWLGQAVGLLIVAILLLARFHRLARAPATASAGP